AVALDAAPDGYHILHSPRTNGRRAGGLALVYRRIFDVTPITVVGAVNSFEAQACRLSVAGKLFVVLNIYRPPSLCIDTFIDELTVVVNELANIGGRLVLLGDFNCPGQSSSTVDDTLLIALSEVGMHVANNAP